MSEKANYFKLGLFVIFATGILLAGVILLGARELFQEYIYLETYLDESVQGIEAGSPVKHRGVRIGSIDKIDFVHNIYDIIPTDEEFFTEGRYVYIRMAIPPDVFENQNQEQVARNLQMMVDEGLRVQMTPQGITGVYYLELEYFDPAKSPAPSISWDPKHIYVPSAPSIFSKLADSVDQVFSRLEKLDIEGLVLRVDTFLEVATSAVQDASVSHLSGEAAALLAELRQTNDSVRQWLEKPELDSIPADASGTLSGARRIVENSEKRVENILAGLEEAATSVARISSEMEKALASSAEGSGAIDDLGVTMKQMRVATEGLPDTIEKINATADELNSLLSSQRTNIEDILNNLRMVSEDMKEITTNAKRYPAHMIFGEPPPRRE
jgi:paraquat-inducible protein B